MSLFAELRRRNVFRVAASYVVVSWLILQVASALQGPLNLPEWFDSVVVALLAIGFPIALVVAWAFELTPDGIQRSSSTDPPGPLPGNTTLDYALIGGLVLVAIVTAWTSRPATTGIGAGETAAEASIAVLPFEDFSADSSQRYFGDGIAEELLNVLARLEGLRVAGRTSSFAYRGENKDLRAIGQALNVATILEGSVRKDGNNLRVTAQLINAADGYHLWTDTYDRELTDIFALQEEIAKAVAGALGVTLGIDDANAFPGAGTESVEAYELYMQALSEQDDVRIGLLEQAIEVDPDYAAAWAQYGFTTAASMWDGLPEEAPGKVARAMSLVQRAVELDPESSNVHMLLGVVRYAGFDWIGGEQAYERAQSLARTRMNFQQNGNLRMRAGRMVSARTLYELGESTEPLGGQPAALKIHVSIAQENYTEAREIASWETRELPSMQRRLNIALNEGDADAVKAAIANFRPSERLAREFNTAILEALDEPERALELLRTWHSDTTRRWISKGHDIALLAAYLGDAELALSAIATDMRYAPVRMYVVWYPIMAEVRRLPAFKDLMREINLVAYWREYGWADFCRPIGDDDFECS